MIVLVVPLYGTCDSGICSCNSGTNGDCSCESCSEYRTCTCQQGYSESDCSIPICDSPSCQNGGWCTSPNNCSCTGAWVGSDCSICSCSNGGNCKFVGYYGDVDNEISSCHCNYSWSSNCSICYCQNNNGSCNSNNICNCIGTQVK